MCIFQSEDDWCDRWHDEAGLPRDTQCACPDGDPCNFGLQNAYVHWPPQRMGIEYSRSQSKLVYELNDIISVYSSVKGL